MNEVWHPVVGYEGLYEASDQGRVKGLKRGRVLKTWLDPDGYAMLELCKDGIRKSKRVHRLVLEAFRGPRPAGMVCCHGSQGKLCNTLANLEWGPLSKNNGIDKYRDGTMYQNRGKLSIEQILAIRSDPRGPTAIARAFGVNRQAVWNIKEGHTWAHV